MSNEQMKELLKEIMKTGDSELISMATEMLKSPPKQEQPKQKLHTNEELDFSMKPDKEQEEISGTPVNKTKRVNTFVDDGTEASDIVTPSFKPTERKRPAYKPIDQLCTRCNKIFKINPTHKREFYTCDKCLGR